MSSAVSRLTPPICLSVANATAPIHSLPTELLLAIFTFVGKNEGFLSMKNKRWRLGRVCSWWRIVVEETPSLWTRIDVSLAEASMLRDPAALLHHTFMEASAEDDDVATAPAFTATDLFTILVAHASSWRRLVLTHFNTACSPVLSKVVGSTTLAKLETLIMTNDRGEDSDDEDENDSGDEEEDWVPNAPLLKRVVIDGVCSLDYDPLHPQLQEFTILTVIYLGSLANLLHKSECLEVLWAEEFREFNWPSDGDSDLPIELPLVVEELDTVDLPNLRTLIAGDPEATGASAVAPAAPYLQSIFELVQFSHCPLTRLALLNCDFAVGNLLEILKLLPLLKMLRINFGSIRLNDAFNGNVDRVLSSLTSALGEVDKESEAFTLVPDLEELRVDFYDKMEVASAFNWSFYTPKVEADFGTRQRRNGKFTASCTFKGEPYFGVTLRGHWDCWNLIRVKPQ
ncbi:hypothetical protein BDZ89DRAFT_1077185 [Hymenopellis radicata]|nr:hypothetical protein BDZ89DRAFT_1077185 [Hymenopellis radicata]